MGTPDFAVTILRTLIENNHHIVGVITAPDKPSGRGRKLNESAVKKYAKSQGLLVLQPANLKKEVFLSELKELHADLQIVVAFRILPKVVWNMPKMGTFNLHASLLPNYRGAAPIHWAIMNGEHKTGVTTFFIDDKIDTGAIILQKEIHIKNDETTGQLHDRLMYLGADLVLNTVRLIAKGNVMIIKQPKTEVKTAPKLYPGDCKIDWNDTLSNVYNKIRGLDPFPTAWTTLKNGKDHILTKIYTIEKVEEPHDLIPGKIISYGKELRVAVKNGFIRIIEIKLSGKKKMNSISLLNGFSFDRNAMMC
ncbi:MAG: methionyl-tRNA formyltransferase [Flavobacteriaceae bacterium]|nr:MAG: methionyl-tRNA formyltransferase [Flavobacteriaceae bacterium]